MTILGKILRFSTGGLRLYSGKEYRKSKTTMFITDYRYIIQAKLGGGRLNNNGEYD